MNKQTLCCTKWEPLQTATGHIYVFPAVRVVRVAWPRYNGVVRQVVEVESDCVTCEHATREFVLAFHDSVFEREELDERDYDAQLEIARGYIYEHLEGTCPMASVGFCDEPVWGDYY